MKRLLFILSFLSVTSLTAQTQIFSEIRDASTFSYWRVISDHYKNDQLKGIIHALNLCVMEGTKYSKSEKIKYSKDMIDSSQFTSEGIRFNYSQLPENLQKVFITLYKEFTPYQVFKDVDFRTNIRDLDGFQIDIRCKVTTRKDSKNYSVQIFNPQFPHPLKVKDSFIISDVISSSTESVMVKTLASHFNYVCPDLNPLVCLEMAKEVSFNPLPYSSRAQLILVRTPRVSEYHFRCLQDHFDGFDIEKVTPSKYNITSYHGDIVGKFSLTNNVYKYESL